ncbi:hypothetical protein Anas_07257 [Armadillidium nasatum]|uniref:Uncharacterized protein n=1 Tax=Armadillidium nasatum TaxID=96803 RepID=A0A5N5SSJ9_9CRUS|nr:hypothetical protein Anas_07257 [Armadillidium nasatum]
MAAVKGNIVDHAFKNGVDLNKSFHNVQSSQSSQRIAPPQGDHWEPFEKLFEGWDENQVSDTLLQIRDEFRKTQMEFDAIIEHRRRSSRFALQVQMYGE